MINGILKTFEVSRLRKFEGKKIDGACAIKMAIEGDDSKLYEFVIEDIFILNKDGKMFANVPSKKSSDDKYYDVAGPINGAARKILNKLVEAAWNEEEVVVEGREATISVDKLALQEAGNLKAFGRLKIAFDADINGESEHLEYLIRDIKVLDGEHGLFAKMPAKQNAEGEWHDVAHPSNKDTNATVKQLFIDAYKAATA